MKNDDTYFGACPVCHGTDGYLNIGQDHWFMCKKHKTKWYIGTNLFSSAMDETPEQQREEQAQLGFDSFDVVEPFYPPPPAKDITTDEAITAQVQKLRSELEQLGRWGIVTWCDEDIVTALEDAGADPSPENVKAVRKHFQVGQIDDRMTEIGFQILAEAIHDLRLAGASDTDKENK